MQLKLNNHFRCIPNYYNKIALFHYTTSKENLFCYMNTG